MAGTGARQYLPLLFAVPLLLLPLIHLRWTSWLYWVHVAIMTLGTALSSIYLASNRPLFEYAIPCVAMSLAVSILVLRTCRVLWPYVLLQPLPWVVPPLFSLLIGLWLYLAWPELTSPQRLIPDISPLQIGWIPPLDIDLLPSATVLLLLNLASLTLVWWEAKKKINPESLRHTWFALLFCNLANCSYLLAKVRAISMDQEIVIFFSLLGACFGYKFLVLEGGRSIDDGATSGEGRLFSWLNPFLIFSLGFVRLMS